MFLLNVRADPWGCLRSFEAASVPRSCFPPSLCTLCFTFGISVGSKIKILRLIFEPFTFCKQVGFGEVWCETAHQQSYHRVLVNQKLETMFKKLLLKIAPEERHLIVGTSQKVVLPLISQSSVGCDWWHRHWFKALLSLKPHWVPLLHHMIVSCGVPPLHSAWRYQTPGVKPKSKSMTLCMFLSMACFLNI